MKVKDIVNYFGPRLNCNTKVHYLGQKEFVFETDGFNYPEDEDLLNAYVIDISIENDDGTPYLDLTLEA